MEERSMGSANRHKSRDFYCSDSIGIRAIIHEHRAVFSKRIDRSQALTPLDVAVNEYRHHDKFNR